MAENKVTDNHSINSDVMARIKQAVPTENTLNNLAELFKVFGDYTRVRIISILFQYEEMCVMHIAEALDMSQSSISHQLRVLKNARLVKNRREGKTIFYSLADDHIQAIFDQGLEHVLE